MGNKYTISTKYEYLFFKSQKHICRSRAQRSLGRRRASRRTVPDLPAHWHQLTFLTEKLVEIWHRPPRKGNLESMTAEKPEAQEVLPVETSPSIAPLSSRGWTATIVTVEFRGAHFIGWKYTYYWCWWGRGSRPPRGRRSSEFTQSSNFSDEKSKSMHFFSICSY